MTAFRQKGGLWRDIVRNRWAYIFISPFYILFAVFSLGPMLFSIYMSMAKWKGLGPIKFVGFKNFSYLLGPGGKAFWQSISTGFILFFMYVPLMTFVAIVLAVILNSGKIRGFRIFRTLLFAPYVTSMIAAGITFRLLLEYKDGLINIMLNLVGLPSVPWLESVWGMRVSLCLLIIWGWLGYNMVIMLAGLQTISPELTEAAKIDGATSVQTFFRITIPLLRPVIVFSLILSTIGTFGLFNEVMALSRNAPIGGPLRATVTPMVHIYITAFRNLRYGRASAMSYVFAVLIFIFTMLQHKYAGRED